jgi:hypothetical protein
MRIVKISGGLGNQIFQYVFGQYLSRKYNEKVYYDINWYKNKKLNKRLYNLELLKFDIDIEILQNREYPLKILDTLIYLLRGLLPFNRHGSIKLYESRTSLIGILLSAIFRNSYYPGYWQNYKYYKYISNEIHFRLKSKKLLINTKIKEKILHTNAVSIGIRRSEENVLKGVVVCDIEYFKKATYLINKKVDNPIYYIFSDDIEWCKKNIKILNEHHFVEQNKDLPFENMELMSLCKHNIISNSSYDWWGAMLNKKNQKIVICPKIWMPKDTEIRKDLIPNEWIKI